MLTSEAVADRKARKLDTKQAEKLYAAGHSMPDIAYKLDVNVSTVWRYLESLKREKREIDEFKANRADAFADLQAKSIELQRRIIESFTDGVLVALTPSQKSGLLGSLNAVAGTIYDKERLERGQSTENVSLLTKVLGSAQDKVFKNQRVTERVTEK